METVLFQKLVRLARQKPEFQKQIVPVLREYLRTSKQALHSEPYQRALERIQSIENRGKDARSGTMLRLRKTADPGKIMGIMQVAEERGWTEIVQMAQQKLEGGGTKALPVPGRLQLPAPRNANDKVSTYYSATTNEKLGEVFATLQTLQTGFVEAARRPNTAGVPLMFAEDFEPIIALTSQVLKLINEIKNKVATVNFQIKVEEANSF